MIETVVFAVVTLAGIFLIAKQPLARKAGISNYWEIGLGTLTILAFLFYLTSTYVTPRMIEDDLAKQPCGSEGPQGRCYNLKRELCEVLWNKADQECQGEMADIFKSRPTGLIGPTLNRCKARHMDKGIRFNRADTESTYCKTYFRYIEDTQN